MLQGKAVIKQPFTPDRKLAGDALHLPTREESINPKNNSGGLSALHDLAAHWPDPDPKKIRAVLVFTDGASRYDNLGGTVHTNQEVDTVSKDLIRAGIAPFGVFYVNTDYRAGSPLNSGALNKINFGGQNDLDQLAKMTNGEALYYPEQTTSMLSSLFYRFYSILYSEALVTVTTKGSGLQRLDVKSSSDAIKVVGPDQVMIGNELPAK